MPWGVPDPLVISSPEGELRIKIATGSASIDGQELALTPTERDILVCLARHYGTVVALPDLIDDVWGDWFGGRGHVNVHVHHLRRKLGPFGRLIVTKRGVGYSLEPPARGLGLPSIWPEDRRPLLGMLQSDAIARGVMWVFVERDLSIAWASDSATELIGWNPDELIGREPREFILETDVPAFLALFPASDGAPRIQFDTHGLHKDGSLVPVRIQANVFYQSDGTRLAGIGEWSRRE